MDNNKTAELEKRIEALEERLNNINFSGTQEITMNGCPVAQLHLNGNGSDITFNHCPFGKMRIDGDFHGSDLTFNHCPIDNMLKKDIFECENKNDECVE